MNATPKMSVVGVDTAKNVFQVYTVDQETGEVINRQLRRGQFLQWFVNRAPCLIGMEACGGSQHWARKLQELGHEVKLMSGKMVKAFVCGNKNVMSNWKRNFPADLLSDSHGYSKTLPDRRQ